MSEAQTVIPITREMVDRATRVFFEGQPSKEQYQAVRKMVRAALIAALTEPSP